MGTYSLNFSSGLYTKSGNTYDLGTLPGWAYSRSSDSNLLTTYAPQSPNLILNSQNILAGTYVFQNTSGATSAIAAPDGSATAQTVTITTTANGFGDVYGSCDRIAGTNYTFSVYVKQGNCGRVLFGQQYNIGGGSNYSDCVFDFGTGTFVVTGPGSPILSATNVGNGWWRLSITMTPLATMSGGQGQCYVGPLDSTATSASGITVGDYVYVWGFQCEQGSKLNGYLPTGSSASPPLATIPATTTNLLQNSSNVGSTNWASTGSPSVSNVTGPNGVASAAQQITTSSGATGYYNTSMTSVSGTVYTSSGYFQWASSGTLLRFVAAAGSFTGAGDAYIEFNGSTGAFSSKSSFITSYTIVPINGWWRVTATWTAASSGAGAGVAAYSASSNASVFNVFGMQVETGAVANPYVPTTANSTASAAIPRVTNLGLWEEPQSINLDNATTTSSPFVATGTTTTDPAGGNTARIQSQTSNFQWAAAAPWISGNTYTVSFYVKSGGGSPALQYLQIPFSTSNVAGAAYVNFDIINGTVTQSSGVTASSITAVLGASGWFRCVITVLCSTTNGLQSYMWPITNGTQGFAGAAPSTASYYTLWGYQNEQSSTATNYILGNANGNAQRGADVNTLTYSPSDSSTTLVWGPSNTTATPSATSPINLGSSSGGAWVATYTTSFVTNSAASGSVGSATGSATVSGTGKAFGIGAGSVSGSAAVPGVGSALFSGVASASGAGSASATGKSLFNATASISASATVTATGNALAIAIASTSGAGSASAVGGSQARGAGAVAGAGSAAATGAALSAGVGASGGAGAAAATGRSIASAVGTATGAATVTGFSPGGSIATATGGAAVSGVGTALYAVVASVSGSATVTAVGGALSVSLGAASGAGSASGVGGGLAIAVGAASGSVSVSGISGTGAGSVGTASGGAVVSGVGNAAISAVASASSAATVSGAGAALGVGAAATAGAGSATATGSALFTASASASGASTAVAFSGASNVAVGTATGGAAVSGVSASIVRAVASASGVGIVNGVSVQFIHIRKVVGRSSRTVVLGASSRRVAVGRSSRAVVLGQAQRTIVTGKSSRTVVVGAAS